MCGVKAEVVAELELVVNSPLGRDLVANLVSFH